VRTKPRWPLCPTLKTGRPAAEVPAAEALKVVRKPAARKATATAAAQGAREAPSNQLSKAGQGGDTSSEIPAKPAVKAAAKAPVHRCKHPQGQRPNAQCRPGRPAQPQPRQPSPCRAKSRPQSPLPLLPPANGASSRSLKRQPKFEYTPALVKQRSAHRRCATAARVFVPCRAPSGCATALAVAQPPERPFFTGQSSSVSPSRRAITCPRVGWWPTTTTGVLPWGHCTSSSRSSGSPRAAVLTHFVFAAQRQRGLLGALRRAAKHAGCLRQLPVEPGGHARSLFFARGVRRRARSLRVALARPSNRSGCSWASAWRHRIRSIGLLEAVSLCCRNGPSRWPAPNAARP
jgi:hypothetical protein